MVTIVRVPPDSEKQPVQAVAPSDEKGWHHLFGGGRQAASGIRVDHRSVIGYPPFWRGVNLLANSVAGLPIDVFRRDGDERTVAGTHPAQRLIKRQASPILRSRPFRKVMMGHALLFGNGFAWIEREGMNPVSLWPLDPQNMLIRFVEGDLWYCTRINGKQVKFPSRDVLHFKGLSHNGVTGYSAVDIMADALGVGMAAQRFGATFFGNGSNQSGILMVPGHFLDEQVRETIKAWDEMAGGLKNAHKVALLQDGVKWQPYSTTPEQGQFLETRNYEVRCTVAAILGVPPHLLGDDSRTSYNSLEQENQSYLVHSLGPWLNEFEGEYEQKLLTERQKDRGSHFVEFNREAAVQMEFDKKIDGLYRQVEIGLMTINEARRKLNEPGVGSDGDIRYRPANWAEVGEEPPPPAPPAAVPAEPQEGGDDEGDGDDSEMATTLRAMIESSVTDAIRIEKRRVVTAAKKEKNFLQWMDGFYEQWTCSTVTGLSTGPAMSAKKKHASESRRQLLDAAGSSAPATFASNVSDLVSTWDNRAVSLTADLMETIQ